MKLFFLGEFVHYYWVNFKYCIPFETEKVLQVTSWGSFSHYFSNQPQYAQSQDVKKRETLKVAVSIGERWPLKTFIKHTPISFRLPTNMVHDYEPCIIYTFICKLLFCVILLSNLVISFSAPPLCPIFINYSTCLLLQTTNSSVLLLFIAVEGVNSVDSPKILGDSLTKNRNKNNIKIK